MKLTAHNCVSLLVCCAYVGSSNRTVCSSREIVFDICRTLVGVYCTVHFHCEWREIFGPYKSLKYIFLFYSLKKKNTFHYMSIFQREHLLFVPPWNWLVPLLRHWYIFFLIDWLIKVTWMYNTYNKYNIFHPQPCLAYKSLYIKPN